MRHRSTRSFGRLGRWNSSFHYRKRLTRDKQAKSEEIMHRNDWTRRQRLARERQLEAHRLRI